MTAGWQHQPALYNALTSLISGVRLLSPESELLRFRHAELLVAQGNFQTAARIMPPLEAPIYTYSDEVDVDVYPSRLLITGAPEHAILVAYQQSEAGNTQAAIAAMQVAIATAPELLGASEWELYRDLTGTPKPALDTLPDTIVEYALAASGTWRGMDIIGVAVDTSTFPANGNGDVAVWLKVLSNTPPPQGIALETGVWWVPYQGINLAPNPSFEWGSATIHNGTIPQGYFSFYTSAGEQGITFPITENQQVLRIEGNGIQGAHGYPIAVTADALYLMGATVETTGRFSMGRRCLGAEGDNRLGLWIHALRDGDVRADWNQITTAQPMAHIALAHPSQSAVTCQFVLESQGGTSTIDNVFLIKIE